LLAVEERSRDTAGDEHAADEVAERGPLRDRRLPRRREPVRNRATRPERTAVVAALVGIGAFLSLTVALRVDDPRIHPGDAADVDGELLSSRRQIVREKHVGFFRQSIENSAAVFRPEVDADALLVARDLRHEEVDSAGTWNQPGGDQATHGIAVDRMLDLD